MCVVIKTSYRNEPRRVVIIDSARLFLSSIAPPETTNDTKQMMEHLELSLSSLGTISKHVDKSHNELAKYLSKQVRSCSLSWSILKFKLRYLRSLISFVST